MNNHLLTKLINKNKMPEIIKMIAHSLFPAFNSV